MSSCPLDSNMANRPTASAFALSHGLALGELRTASATCAAVTSAAANATAEAVYKSHPEIDRLRITILPFIGFVGFYRTISRACHVG